MDFKLIIKEINGNLSKEEKIEFDEWINSSSEHQEYYNKVVANFHSELTDIDIDNAWASIEQKINGSKKRPRKWSYAVAATIALFITSTYFLLVRETTDQLPDLIVNTEIKAGTDKAILTLDDGSLITLERGENYTNNTINSDGEHLYYHDIQGVDQLNIAYNILTVPKGGEFYVELPDKTKVWLNSESQLKYPTHFEDGELREIELVYGEAFFDVSPSTEHKGSGFRVRTAHQTIDVLGTQFNIKAYSDDTNIFTSLVEGKIEVSTSDRLEVLLPGQQSIVNSDTKSLVKIDHKEIENFTAWKSGSFLFKKVRLEDIMTQLARWYDIQFEFEDANKKDLEFSAVLDRNENITKLLNNFQRTGEVSFNIVERTVIIK